MLRSLSVLSGVCSRAVLRDAAPVAARLITPMRVYQPLVNQLSKLHTIQRSTIPSISQMSLTSRVSGLPLLAPTTTTSVCQRRSVIKFGLQKGKRKTVKAVLKRFKRLEWGGRSMWIRPMQGANKKVWKKTVKRKVTKKTHVFTNATQSRLLDKMVNRYWRRMRHYPDDPYKPYHRRDNYPHTESRPREFF